MAGDSYRPQPSRAHRQHHHHPPPPPPPPPSAHRPPPPPPPPPSAPRQTRNQGQNRPALADRVTFTGGAVDSYRPGQQSLPQHQFTFSSNIQAPRFTPMNQAQPNGNSASRRGRGRGRGRGDNNNSNHHSRPQNHDAGQNGGAPPSYGDRPPARRPWNRPPRTHERQFLQKQHTNGPVETLGVKEGVNKFLNPDDLSESEGEMDIEGDEEEEEEDQPSPKLVRVENTSRADGDSVPKWSNPDPYFVLPPSHETSGKKLDVVQLIRRAKAQVAEASSGRNAVAENDDFISLDNEPPAGSATRDPPTGPRALLPARPQLQPLSSRPSALEGSLNQVALTQVNALVNVNRNGMPAGLPQRPALPPSQHPVPQNKRKHGQIESSSILSEWVARPSVNPAPWAVPSRHIPGVPTMKDDYSRMMLLLSKEIVDFVETFQPDTRTDEVRNDIVRRINTALTPLKWLLTEGSIQCFGSFPAGLYLPTADMDLVYVSNRHLQGGPRNLNMESRKQIQNILRTTAKKLEVARIAKDVVIIAKAKVPIIKFKDRMTDVHIDLSFENLTGIDAQRTFLQWKSTFGNEMIYLVAFVKQFLVMRGLSDVHTGGLGGFSTICLVVFFLHIFHEQHDRRDDPGLFGRQLIAFLDFYGNKFDLEKIRICMNPIRLVAKDRVGVDGRPEKPDRLSIQDPNNPQNNISGGSSRVKEIFRHFATAHSQLREQCMTWDNSGSSVLQTIIGGDYDSYYTFRDNLYQYKLPRS